MKLNRMLHYLFKDTKVSFLGIMHTSMYVHVRTVHPCYTVTVWTELYFGDKKGWQYISSEQFTHKIHDNWKFDGDR